MKRELRLVVWLFVGVMAAVFLTLLVFIAVHETSRYNTEWAASGIQKLLSIVEIVVGAVVGALGTAVAYSFRDRSKGGPS
jgi:uncharacterized membrane protein